MTDRERLEVLGKVHELSGVGTASLRALFPFFDEVSVTAGAVVAREGQLAHELLIVADGALEACRNGRASRLDAGEAFGWQAMQDRGRHDATVTAVTPARLLVMSHAQFGAAEVLAGSIGHRAASSYTAPTGAAAHVRPPQPV